MRFDYSPAVQRALQETDQLAAQRAQGPTPALLLEVLLRDEEGQVAELLARCGLPVEQARRALQASAAESPDCGGVEELLLRARALAGRYGEDATVSGEYLLWALLEVWPRYREEVRACGVDLDALERQILRDGGAAIALNEAITLDDPVDELAAGRVLDVNANRVRESLRILDDYCRFVLDDATLTQLCKDLRHDFVAVLNLLPERVLLLSRETTHDVGTALTAGGEYQRLSTRHLARVNLKRLQESLRSIEEYAKIFSADHAARFEQLRYRAYTLEKTLLQGADDRERLARATLYLLLSLRQCGGSLEWTIGEAAAGGVDVVQLREKEVGDRELLARARRVRAISRECGTLFILNDRPDLARLSGADGVHLGQDDVAVHEARKILGADALIGVSTHEPGQLRQAIVDGASYLGVGPTFPSTTKQFTDFAGLDYLRQASGMTTLPWFAIGGITADNLGEVMEAGARRVAVSGAILQASDPRAAARELKSRLGG